MLQYKLHEVCTEAKKVLVALNNKFQYDIEFEEAEVGGAAFDKYGKPLPEATLEAAKKADAILLGAVGGPAWDDLDYDLRPERALLGLRSQLDLFANLRPAILSKHLVESSSLKSEKVEDLDLLIVRELTGGIYFGEPRGNIESENSAFNTMIYSREEIERIGRVAFEAAQKRSKSLCSVDKANVLEVSVLWREVIIEISKDYPDVELTHMLVDNAAMQLVKEPKQFDVIVTGNLFGDILSDIAAMLTGSIGMLPSASLNSKNQGLYEPVHGSAEPWTGSYKPWFFEFKDAEGSIPIDPVNIAAISERISPNKLPVTITSNCLGSLTNCIAALSTSIWVSSTSG